MSNEMTRTDGENTNEGLSNAPVESAAPNAGEAPAQTQSADTGTQQEASGEKAEVQQNYEFVVPEGAQVHPDVTAHFGNLAKRYNLSKDAAEGIYSETAKLVADLESRQNSELRERWRTESINDPEFGGDNLNANLAYAQTALSTYFSQDFMHLLNQTPLVNNPELIRGLIKIGKDIGEDRLPGSMSNASRKEKSPEEILYDGN